MEKRKNKYKGLCFMIYMTESELKTVGQVKANTIILGDCLKVLPYIADSSISAMITDLPYG